MSDNFGAPPPDAEDPDVTRIRPAGLPPGAAATPPPYGQQPDPYGQQPAYGQQPGPYGQQPPYPQANPYAQQPPAQYGGGYGQQPPMPYGGGYGPPPGLPPAAYASWGDRVVATLWDFLYLWPGLLAVLGGTAVIVVGTLLSASASDTLGVVVIFLGIAVMIAGYGLILYRAIRNQFLDQGRTGYTYGKRKVGIRLIDERTGQPVGAGMAFVRYLLHSVINQACYLDYLWPLWDVKRQTLTDKILTHVVIYQPDPQAPPA